MTQLKATGQTIPEDLSIQLKQAEIFRVIAEIEGKQAEISELHEKRLVCLRELAALQAETPEVDS